MGRQISSRCGDTSEYGNACITTLLSTPFLILTEGIITTTRKNLRLLRQRSDELCREYSLSVIEHPSGRKKPYALYQAEKNGLPTRDTVARQAVDEAISKSFTLKDFDRQLSEMGYRINFRPQPKILDDYRQKDGKDRSGFTSSARITPTRG